MELTLKQVAIVCLHIYFRNGALKNLIQLTKIAKGQSLFWQISIFNLLMKSRGSQSFKGRGRPGQLR